MNDARARFEEIWPVPEGVYWSMNTGHYVCDDSLLITRERMNACTELDIRLDTFTRCQETTDVYVSLVDELVQELELAAEWVEKKKQGDRIDSLIDRAKQIMEQNK